MSYKPIRVADIEVDRRTISTLRAIFPWWGILVLILRKRNHRIIRREVASIGVTAAKVVTEAQDGAKALRRLTVWLVVLTLVNTGFVIYSAMK